MLKTKEEQRKEIMAMVKKLSREEKIVLNGLLMALVAARKEEVSCK